MHRPLATTLPGILASALFLQGCTTTMSLPANLYQPAYVNHDLVPARVLVVADDKMPAKVSRHGGGPLGWGEVTLGTYPDASVDMLKTIFTDVELAGPDTATHAHDLVVHLKPDFPRTVGMTFQDGGGRDIVTLARQEYVSFDNKGVTGADVVMGIVFAPAAVITLGLGMIAPLSISSDQATILHREVVDGTRAGLADLREDILDTDELTRSPAQTAALHAAESQGDSALAANDPVGAILGYQTALGNVYPGSESALRVQGKTINAVLRSGGQPPVPEQALDLMARGRAAVAQAKSPTDYIPASQSMERALLIAPWWGAGHMNTALTEESAGLWARAATHLKLYLAINPQAPDHEQVRMKMAELQLHEEKGDLPAGSTRPSHKKKHAKNTATN